ncbi:MAG: 1,2-phenylacetyl-CoA epoxidase subunit PaaD [Bacteroidia bacterium]
MFTRDQIFTLLEEVKDPEIPVISLVQLGVVKDVRVEGEKVYVDIVPTFAGCPAIEMMKNDVIKTLSEAGVKELDVQIKYKSEWTTNQISPKGRVLLKDFGLSPPRSFDGELTLEELEYAQCPRCDSVNTRVLSVFGPTACRSIHHCEDCHETFEQMKPL